MAKKKLIVKCKDCSMVQEYYDTSEKIDRETWPDSHQCVWCDKHNTLEVVSILYIDTEEKK